MSMPLFPARFGRALLSALAGVVLTTLVGAQPAATLTGRVQNAAVGAVLENARVTLAGTNREAFTDAFGEYRFTGLPPGAVTVQVFFTGTVPQTAGVTLATGETVRRDFSLVPIATAGAPKAAGSDGVVRLDAFVFG